MKELVFERQKMERQQPNRNLADNSFKKIPKVIDKTQEYTFSPEKSTNLFINKKKLFYILNENFNFKSMLTHISDTCIFTLVTARRFSNIYFQIKPTQHLPRLTLPFTFIFVINASKLVRFRVHASRKSTKDFFSKWTKN